MPLNNGTWPGPFPDTTDYGAPGDLATVTFKSIYQHDELDLTSDIYLDEITLANTAGIPIPYDTTKTAEEGICKYTITSAVPPFIWIENGVDLFTQYALRDDDWTWYGGIGLDAVSDAFPPQAVVNLIGYVKYHNDPVPGKPVAYEITDPNGAKYYATAFSDNDGFAIYEFSLPTGSFGIWDVTASVDLGGTVYVDHLAFIEGWLVKPWDIIISPDDIVVKETNLNVSISLARICAQAPEYIMDVLLSTQNNSLLMYVTLGDELKQIVGETCFEWTSDWFSEDEFKTFKRGDLLTIWDTYNEGVGDVGELFDDRKILEYYIVEELSIYVPAWAFTGDATLHVNVLTDLPGVPYCGKKC